jgi:predicted transcriptional regulator
VAAGRPSLEGRADEGWWSVPERRPVGSLERAVLEQLWAAAGPVTPREVLERLDADLAYTTVVTILTRLVAKGLVARERAGKAYVYRPEVAEADLIAERMRTTLASAGDRKATLSRFVEGLSKREARALRNLLDDVARGRP